jgi:hypothetical protein
MKPNLNTRHCLRSLLLGAALAMSVVTNQAQNVVLDFNSDSIWAQTNQTSLATWQWWGGCTTTREWVTNDVADNPESGSVKISITWPVEAGTGLDFQYSIGLPLSGAGNYDLGITLTPINYTNVEFDILWDTNLSTATIEDHMDGQNAGDPNGFGIGFVATQFGQTWAPNADQPRPVANGTWEHFSIPINPAWPVIPGMIFKKWRSNSNASATNLANKSSVFYVDNIVFNFNTNLVIPPPEMKIEPANVGLNVMATGGGQYQRNGIRSIPADAVQWVGNPDPVTYSVTLTEFPSGASYSGYQAHIYLAPDTTGGNAPDWDDANVILVQFQENGDGTGVCNFRFKTNAPASNGELYGSGTIMQLIAPTVLGTWNVTFTNDHYITITGPGGVSTNFSMGPDAAALFQTFTPSMGTYFGTVPGQPANLSQRAVLSNIKVMNGATTVVDDSFPVAFPPDEVDINQWIVRSDGGAIALKVVEQPGNYWLHWNLPDPYASGVQISSNVLTDWVDSGLSFRLANARHEVFVPTNILIGTGYENASFFRLFSTNAP